MVSTRLFLHLLPLPLELGLAAGDITIDANFHPIEHR